MQINEWWDSMTSLEHFFWVIAAPSSLIFLIIVVLTFIGGDIDGDTDIDSDTEGGDTIPFQFFTVKNLIGFFTIFSWTGIACIKGGFSFVTVLLISTTAGLAMMVVMAFLFYMMSKLVENGNININKSIGNTGQVYLTIPKNRESYGKVQLKVEGSFQTLDALSDESSDIKTGVIVEVIDIVNNSILIVKPSSKK